MHGTAEAFKKTIMDELLVEVDLNVLEKGLMEKYLEAPEDKAVEITNCLNQAKDRLAKNDDNRRAIKCLGRVIPLFDKHEFWSTQPVMRCYEPIGKINEPVEHKTLSDVQQEGIALPQQYQWCEIDMEDKAVAMELYDLLTNHYVEDDGGNFRFDYSMEFL